MDKQDWALVEKRLKHLYFNVHLVCDGYKLTLRLEQRDQYRNAIGFFVNGILRFEWLLDDCEERRRFCCECRKFAYTAKQRKQLKQFRKRYGKKDLKKYCLTDDPDKKLSYWSPWWLSFSSLKRHLLKNNKEITLVKEELSELMRAAVGGVETVEGKEVKAG